MSTSIRQRMHPLNNEDASESRGNNHGFFHNRFRRSRQASRTQPAAAAPLSPRKMKNSSAAGRKSPPTLPTPPLTPPPAEKPPIVARACPPPAAAAPAAASPAASASASLARRGRFLNRPGVQFCSNHDAISAKIASVNNNNKNASSPSSPTRTPRSSSMTHTGSGYTHVTYSEEDTMQAKVAATRHAPAASDEPLIEISPGVTARLRGAEETMACIENDFYFPTNCMFCTTDICVIMDANYVLCPICKIVSPREGCDEKNIDGGVGLGFTFEDLQKWQCEIVVCQRQQGLF